MSVVTPLIAALLPGGVPLLAPSVTRAVSRLVDDAPTALDPRVEDGEDSEEGQYVEDVILWPGVTKRETKRDRIPLAQRDWLSRLCLRQGATRIADRLFPRLAPLARDKALLALLAAEANGDGYLVGRDPWTGDLERLPSPNDHVIVEPQRFRLYWFVSEHPLDLCGNWRSLKVWSLRWQACGSRRWESAPCPVPCPVPCPGAHVTPRDARAPLALTVGDQAHGGLPGLRVCCARERQISMTDPMTDPTADPTHTRVVGGADGWTPGGD